MKTLSLKQIRNAALCLAAAVFVGYGLNTVRPAATLASHSAVTHTLLLADSGQETHGGKNGGHLIRIRQVV
jgi:hypothetical protein